EDDADFLQDSGKEGLEIFPDPYDRRGDHRVLEEQAGHQENRAIADAGENRHQDIGAELAEARAVEEVVSPRRSEVPAEKQKGDGYTAHPHGEGYDEAGEVFAGDQHFAAHGREEVIVQGLLEHLTAEEIGEDTHGAEEDSGAQVIEHEESGE